MKTKRHTIILSLGVLCAFVIMSLAGCGSGAYSKSSNYENVAAEEASYDTAVAEEASYYNTNEIEAEIAKSADTIITDNMPADNRKFIKTLDVDMQTMDFDKTTSSIADMVGELGGYIEQSNISGNSLYDANNSRDSYYNPRSANYVLRIPVDKLNMVADKLSVLGNVTNRSEGVEDVTANYTDIERRIETLKVQEERLLEILKTADELEYIITLETKLSDVRYEIEGYTSALNGLDNKVNYSFVNIYVSEVIEYDDVRVAPPTFGARIASGFTKSINAIVDFGQTLVIMLVTILPFLVVWGGILVLLIVGIIKCKKLYRKKHPKKVKAQKEHESIIKEEQKI